jgi:peptide/nickel transport system ATP-binding protein
MVTNSKKLLEIHDLGVSFKTDEGLVRAVDHVSLTVQDGKTLGIVGESGSGKSVTVKAIMQLLPKNVVLDPKSSIKLHRGAGRAIEITRLRPTGSEMRAIRGNEIAMIFQEPMASFSPLYTIGNQIAEAILAHTKMSRKQVRRRAIELLTKVGINNPEVRVDQYPFEMSGGMRQRAMIAIALASSPSLLIADEPTTALDVTIQAQILALIKQLQADYQMAVIFITHDLGVISQVADEVAVMYLGRVVEQGITREIIGAPQHPYTQSLLKAIPTIHGLEDRLKPIPGDIPSPLERPAGCPFHTRCAQRMPGICDVLQPGVTHVSPTHTVNCFLYERDAS